jgi:adenosylcobinamide kinase / adenosylcobinamide-phosphate guanylyltransferase
LNTRLVLVTGGTRSGKSAFAASVAESTGAWPVYIATALAADQEMAERIAKHRRERGSNWTTVEEPLNITRTLAAMTRGENAVVIDCLTLWLTNIMMQEEDEFELAADIMSRELANKLRNLGGTVVVVTNEIGMGVVPADAATRRFRDVAGSVNRLFAQTADEVHFMVSGIPMKLK